MVYRSFTRERGKVVKVEPVLESLEDIFNRRDSFGKLPTQITTIENRLGQRIRIVPTAHGDDEFEYVSYKVGEDFPGDKYQPRSVAYFRLDIKFSKKHFFKLLLLLNIPLFMDKES